MNYKQGDRVKIKSLDWYNENKDEYGCVRCIDFLFTPEHSKYCGCEFTVSHITEFRIPSYVMENNGHEWTDEMIEGLVEEEIEKKLSDESWRYKNIFDHSQYPQSFECPDGYQFKDENGNVINTQKIVLEKKKKEYPKTFEECVHVLEGENRMSLEQMNTFRKLIDARNAYWKIAGEEMGLGKPWQPKLLDDNQLKFALANWDDNIEERDYSTNRNYILTFPTEEMRDAFYENFKELIEQCKELL